MHTGFTEESWQDAAVEVSYRIKHAKEPLAWAGVKKVVVTFVPGLKDQTGPVFRPMQIKPRE